MWGEVLGVLMFHGGFFRAGRFIPGNMDCTDTLTGLVFFGCGELGAMGEWEKGPWWLGLSAFLSWCHSNSTYNVFLLDPSCGTTFLLVNIIPWYLDTQCMPHAPSVLASAGLRPKRRANCLRTSPLHLG